MKNKIDKQAVYDFLAIIPKGKVVTYGQIAAFLGNPDYARTVGNILHENPDGDKYPCYKVVNSAGKLSANYAFGGLPAQKQRLEKEGILVQKDKVDLKCHRWSMEIHETKSRRIPDGYTDCKRI